MFEWTFNKAAHVQLHSLLIVGYILLAYAYITLLYYVVKSKQSSVLLTIVMSNQITGQTLSANSMSSFNILLGSTLTLI